MRRPNSLPLPPLHKAAPCSLDACGGRGSDGVLAGYARQLLGSRMQGVGVPFPVEVP